jgi:large repetitive protein
MAVKAVVGVPVRLGLDTRTPLPAFPAQGMAGTVGTFDPPRWEVILMRRKAERSSSLFSALHGIFTGARQRAQRRAKIRNRLRSGFEMLEGRRLLAATDLAMIQGLVFEDTNDNGYEIGEEVAGATIHLYLDDGDGIFDPEGDDDLAATVLTDDAGIYRFENLSAGNYFVQQPAQDIAASSLSNRVSSLISISEQDAAGTEVGILDSFDETPQSVVVSVDGGLTAGSSVAAPEALGGERELFAELTSELGSMSLDVNGVVPGLLEFQSSPTAVGRLVATWDGPDGDPFQLDPEGLEGVDLTSGGAATTLSLRLGADQDGGQVLIRIFSDADNFSTATLAIPDTGGAATESLTIHFSDFDVAEGTGADFANVGAVELEILGSAGYDGQFSTISTLGPTVLTQDFDNVDRIDLAVTKTAETLTPAIESNVTFTIAVANLGTTAATGVELTDILPVDLAFVMSNPSQGTYDALTGVWQIGELDAGSEATLELVALVAALGAKTNIAAITAADQPDSNPDNDQDSLTIVPASIDLSLTKVVDDETPVVGSNITFTMIVANAGPLIATGVEVTDQLPEGLEFVSADPSQGVYNPETGVWVIGAIEAGSSVSLDLVATVTTLGEKTNVAEVTAADQLDVNSTPGNNDPEEDDQDSVTIFPQSPAEDFIDLELTKTADQLTQELGGDIVFTITVTNLGLANATGVEVTDWLPEGLAFASATPSQGTYDDETGLWVVGAIESQSLATLELIVTATTVGAWVNTAEVTAADQPDLNSTPGNNDPAENDQDSVTILVGAIDLELTKTADETAPGIGQQVTFTITVSNLGPHNATGVEVTDLLPEGLDFVSATPSQGTYDDETGLWIVGDIDSSASATLELIVTATTVGARVNTAEVTAADQPDLNSMPGNNDPAENDQDSVTILVGAIDLELTKTADETTPGVGQQVAFTITVSNLGPHNATGVEVTDLLPEGLDFVSATPSQGTYDDETGLWIVGDIDSSASATLELIVTASGAGALVNTAEVTAADQPDLNSTPGNNDPTENDQDSVTILVGAIDLELTKTADETAPGIGQQVTFTITVSNLGPNNATGVEVTDLLPEGLDFVSATPSQGTYDDETGLWIVGDIDSSASATLELIVTASGAGALVNTAEVTAADQPDLNSTPGNNDPAENDQDSVEIIVAAIDLELTKSADTTTPGLGESVTFTILVTNLGPSTATGVEVTDQLPAGLNFVSATFSQGTYDSETGVWVVGQIDSSGSATLQLVATVTQLETLVNTAEVTAADQPDLNSTPGNNDPDENDQDSVTLTPAAIDLSLTKSASNTSPNLGEDITFTILVTNLGPHTATGVEVTDQLPEGLTFVAATPSQGTYDAATGIWLVGTIESDASATLTIVATVATVGTKVNTAEVTAADQPDLNSTPGNNDPEENDQDSVTIVTQVIDLELTKTVSSDTPDLRSNVTFTIQVSNAGPSQATGVEVTDLLPEGMTLISFTPSQGTYDAATGIWLVGAVAPDAAATLELVARVDTVGAKTNTAEVTAADQPDLNSTPGNNDPEENDQDSATIVPVAIDLVLSKRASTSIPLVGGNVTFTITVSNSGPSTATGVSVLDQLPEGLTFVSATASQGSYDAATGIWTVGTIASEGNATLDLVAVVDTAGVKTNTAEVLTADQEDINSTPGNNDPDENDQDSVTITPGSGFSKRLFLAR